MIEKLECTCIDAYKTRKMRDPNCCACSCNHNDLVEQLAKANERVKRIEKIFSEAPDLTFDEVQSMFSEELNKFAIEQKVEAVTLFASSANEMGQFGWSDCQWLTDYAEEWVEQLRKEQE